MSDMILTLVYCWIIFFFAHTPHIWMRRWYFFSIFSLHFFCLTILRFIEGSITDKFLTVGLLMSSRHVLWSGRSFFGLFQFLAKSFFMGHRIVLSNHKMALLSFRSKVQFKLAKNTLLKSDCLVATTKVDWESW